MLTLHFGGAFKRFTGEMYLGYFWCWNKEFKALLLSLLLLMLLLLFLGFSSLIFATAVLTDDIIKEVKRSLTKLSRGVKWNKP